MGEVTQNELEKLEAFGALVNRYLKLIDNLGEFDEEERVDCLLQALSSLYMMALQRPTVSPYSEAGEFNHEEHELKHCGLRVSLHQRSVAASTHEVRL